MEKITCGAFQLSLSRPLIMGVLNVTPDSFSDGGKFIDVQKAVQQALKMLQEGADIIDIGGESTRPGAQAVSTEVELQRVLPVIDILLRKVKIPLSIDTMKPEVAWACLQRGVQMLNDVTGLRTPKMMKIAAQFNVPTIIMHMLGEPQKMQENPHYDNVINDIKDFLARQANAAKKAGISQIILDPGIGFGKTVEHNLMILQQLEKFKDLGYPLLVGPSRKSFIGKILNTEADQRLEGTLAAVTVAVMNGANILRVHDVKECRRAAIVAEAIRKMGSVTNRLIISPHCIVG